MDKVHVEREAKKILTSFAKELEKVKIKDEEIFIERDKFERGEGVKNNNVGFKSKLLGNAPHKDDNFVIVEKGGWINEDE